MQIGPFRIEKADIGAELWIGDHCVGAAFAFDGFHVDNSDEIPDIQVSLRDLEAAIKQTWRVANNLEKSK